MGKLGLTYELEALPDREQHGEDAVRDGVFYVLRDEGEVAPPLAARCSPIAD